MDWENWIKFLKDFIKGYKIMLIIYNGLNFVKIKNMLFWIMYIYNNSLNLRWFWSLVNIFFRNLLKNFEFFENINFFFLNFDIIYMIINK